MLLKILLLQVMSIGLITIPIKAQDTLVEIPEIYMEESDKAVMNSIWNIAGFPSDQQAPSDVERKFMATLGHAVPVLMQQLPFVGGMMPFNHFQTSNDNRQNKQIHQTGSSYVGSPTTINYKVLPKPPNSELDSSEEDESPGLINSRRTLHPENIDLEITNENDKETNGENYPTENLETSPQNLETMNLPMERMQRMMQLKGTDDNTHINKKSRNSLRRNSHQSRDGGKQSHGSPTEVDNRPRMRKNKHPTNKPTNFLGRKSHQNINGDVQSHDTHADVDSRSKTRKESNSPAEENATLNRNSHIEIPKHSVHKKKYNRKTVNTTRNTETSTHQPTVTNHKYTKKRKESQRKSDKLPDTSRYYQMVDNNQNYMCKCNLMRRKSEELNTRKSYTERIVDHKPEPVFNCTKFCNVTKENVTDTKSNMTDTVEKDNRRLRSRHDKVKYHVDKRENEGDDPGGEEEPVKPKATRSRKYRHKHRNQEYNAATEKEDILINYHEVTDDDNAYLPTENQFAINDEYRSSIDPVQAYADESAYRPVVNPMFGYPDEGENDPNDPAMDPMRSYGDEPDYEDTAVDPSNSYATDPDYRQIVPQMNSYVDDSNYGAMDDANPSDYIAPVEVLHNVKGYNPFMNQYQNDPQDYMYIETQDMYPAT